MRNPPLVLALMCVVGMITGLSSACGTADSGVRSAVGDVGTPDSTATVLLTPTEIPAGTQAPAPTYVPPTATLVPTPVPTFAIIPTPPPTPSEVDGIAYAQPSELPLV